MLFGKIEKRWFQIFFHGDLGVVQWCTYVLVSEGSQDFYLLQFGFSALVRDIVPLQEVGLLLLAIASQIDIIGIPHLILNC